MPRPLVAVYQEFAQLNLPTPASADLNTCVVAVAKRVVDVQDGNLTATLVNGATFDASALSLDPVGLQVATDVLETATVTFFDPEVLVQASAGITRHATETASLLFPTLEATGASADMGNKVSVGHLVYGKDALGNRVYVGKIMTITPVDEDGDEVKDPIKDAALIDAYEIGLDNDVEEDNDVLDVESANAVIVTRVIPGAYDVLAGQVDVDAVYGKVNVQPTASIQAPTYDGKRLANGNPTPIEQWPTPVTEVRRCSKVHVAYVARRRDLNFLQTVSDAQDLVNKLGPIDSRNPLGLAAWLALTNSGTSIYVYGVKEESLAEFGEFQRKAMPRSDIYCIVPVCVNDPEVQLAVVQGMKAKLNNMADATYALENGVPQRFKMVVAGGFPPAVDPKTIVTLASTATVEAVSGVEDQYRVTDPEAKFYDKGVRVGDAVTTDATTSLGADVGTVVRVISNSAIIVSQNIDPAADPVYIVRKLEEAETVADLSAVPKGVSSKRIVMLLGQHVTVPSVAGSELLSAAYLGCAVGGMIAGLPPHSGLTNLSVSGIADVKGTHDSFEEENLSKLSDAGWCIFIEDTPSAAPFCLHGVTTDITALEFSEIMSVKNFDYVSATLSSSLNQFLGTWNINSETLGFISSTIGNVIGLLQSQKVPKLGAPLTSGSLDSLAQSSISADRVEVYVTLQMPKSLNRIGLHLVSA